MISRMNYLMPTAPWWSLILYSCSNSDFNIRLGVLLWVTLSTFVCVYCFVECNSFFSSEFVLDPEKVGLSCFSFKKRSLTQLKRSRRCLTLGRIFQNGVEGNFSTPTLVG